MHRVFEMEHTKALTFIFLLQFFKEHDSVPILLHLRRVKWYLEHLKLITFQNKFLNVFLEVFFLHCETLGNTGNFVLKAMLLI